MDLEAADPAGAAGAADAARAARPARVRLLTRDGCHLCDEARAVVAQVCAELGESYEEVDLDRAALDDPELRGRYTDEVPVTFVDGAQHDYWRVDPDRLRRALTRARA